MRRIGFTVPDGFCITTAVYREHLETNSLTDKIKSAVDKLNLVATEDRRSILLEIREAIINAHLSEELCQQIENNYRKLGADCVAVRSSATAEDLPGYSFAGQYDSYLNVIDLDGCIEAIKKCWASLWSQRAYDYRRKSGFDHLKVDMAVIVQEMVQADVAGVIFTADPVTGYQSRMIIEACCGLGDALVSGKVTPDRFIIDKKKGRILLKKNLSCQPCITDSTVKKLTKVAKKVEKSFDCLQDIEWAIRSNKIYFLQSRDITTKPEQKSWEERQMWCSNPVKEVMPDVVTPITLSMLIELIGKEFLDPLFRLLCCDRGNHPIYTLIAGRIYFNANIWPAVIRHLPGIRNCDFNVLAGGHKELQQLIEKLETATDEELPEIKFSPLRLLLKMPVIIIGALANTPKKGQRILAKINVENEKWKRLEVARLSAEQILESCQEIIIDFRKLLSDMLYLFTVLAALPVLDLICERWLSETSSCTGRLLAGIGDMDDAVAGLEIWQLAAAADATPEVKNLILSNDDWHNTKHKLSQLDSGRKFLESWDQFMDNHGHHCRGELELYNPRWSETPDYILNLLRTYTTQIGRIDPVENYHRCVNERLQLEKQCRIKLRNPIKRIIFNHILIRSQQGSVFRENVKSEVIKLVVSVRKMFLELGKRLEDKGVLENRNDIFFLRFEEVETVVHGKADFDIHQVIATRREEYDRNKSITPPDVVFGRFDPDKYVPEIVDKDVTVLKGLAVSPGVVTGKARVILRADTDEHILAGEIFVAPFTDPGWTPYFVPAAGVVMDQGGLLSHGSIVAREYGIPAVVNVGPATKIIKTGQRIQVDANNGVVRIIR